MPSAPPAPTTHFPPTSYTQPPPPFPGQNVQPGVPTQWAWQPIPGGNQVPHGPPPFQPGQNVFPFSSHSFDNSFQSPHPPNNFPTQTIMIQVPPAAVQSAWTTGLFDCLDDPLNAAVAFLFPCVTFGQVAEIVDNGSTSCATGALLYGGIQFLIGFPCLISCAYRTRMRSKFNLIESPAPDWLTHFLCECCALAQEYRELHNRGYDPAIGWQGNATNIRIMQPLPQPHHTMVPPMNQAMRG
ncbi:hypothetical protein MLD38_022589 [Melastoma candidum]|uniref:Uncharacterized protein n=1 Tax=Melastoma candidum TaxID=119954 RepID=A0ACB9QNN8_9MYRT|nr:hypothetical protein MLD38_022589 [Melastoma candidum]